MTHPRIAHLSRRVVRFGGVVLVLCAIVAALELRRRHDLYWYDVTADYQFGFSNDGQRAPVHVSADGFTLPHWNSRWDTALLRLDIDSSLAGSWAEPSLEVTHDAGTCSQYFERAAEGRRFVNLCLTSASAAPGMRIRLQGNHLRWNEQNGEILLFANPVAPKARLLVLAPHPDDAEIAAFGLYAHRDSWIVTITNGSYGGDVYRSLVASGADADRLQADLRVSDSVTAALWAGLPPDHAVNLGFFTLTLEEMYHHPEAVAVNPVTGDASMNRWRRGQAVIADRPATPTWITLVDDLAAIVRDVAPDVVVAPHPALDSNVDHVFTTAALLAALEQLDDPPIQLLLYSNHHVHSEYYPFGPAEAVVTLPPWFDADLPIRGVISNPLSRAVQIAKLFALDSMHDLRRPPQPVYGGVGERLLSRIGTAAREVVRDPVQELSYFRRAVRPNELFFSYDAGDRPVLQRLIENRSRRKPPVTRTGPRSAGSAAHLEPKQ